MTQGRDIARWLIVKPLWFLTGRRNLVRLARFMSNEGRLDVPNGIERNGELLIQGVVARTVKLGQTLIAIDAGANVGEWTRHLARAAETARVHLAVHAFEPSAGTARTLRRNLMAWGLADRVDVNECALSDVPGERTFYTYGEDAGRNTLEKMSGEPACKTERVEVTTLDGYASRTGVTHVDVMKVDTEGHDLAVLRGAEAMLRDHRIRVIQFEYNSRWVAARAFLADAFDFLRPMGYRLGKVTPLGVEFYSRWHPELETFREGNYLAALPDAASRFPEVPWWNEGR